MIDSFLLGTITTCSLIAAAFFLKFWKQTRAPLFLAFTAAFAIEAVNRVAILLLPTPSLGNDLIYGVRLLSYLLILAAIVQRNRA